MDTDSSPIISNKPVEDNWFVKAYIINTSENVEAKTYFDTNFEHVKFFLKQVKSDIEVDQRVIMNAKIETIKNDFTTLVEKSQERDFKYSHIMLIFSVYGTESQNSDDVAAIHFNELITTLNKSIILKNMLKVIVFDILDMEKPITRPTKCKETKTCDSKCILPNGVNFMYYYGRFYEYDKELLKKGSFFLRVLFHQLLSQSLHQNSIRLDDLFEICNNKLIESGTETVKRNFVGSLCTAVIDPLMVLKSSEPIEKIEDQYQMLTSQPKLLS